MDLNRAALDLRARSWLELLGWRLEAPAPCDSEAYHSLSRLATRVERRTSGERSDRAAVRDQGAPAVERELARLARLREALKALVTSNRTALLRSKRISL